LTGLKASLASFSGVVNHEDAVKFDKIAVGIKTLEDSLGPMGQKIYAVIGKIDEVTTKLKLPDFSNLLTSLGDILSKLPGMDAVGGVGGKLSGAFGGIGGKLGDLGGGALGKIGEVLKTILFPFSFIIDHGKQFEGVFTAIRTIFERCIRGRSQGW